MWSYPFNAPEKKIRPIHFFAAAAILTGSVGNGYFVFIPQLRKTKMVLKRIASYFAKMCIYYIKFILRPSYKNPLCNCSKPLSGKSSSGFLFAFASPGCKNESLRANYLCGSLLGRSHQGRIDGTCSVRLCSLEDEPEGWANGSRLVFVFLPVTGWWFRVLRSVCTWPFSV